MKIGIFEGVTGPRGGQPDLDTKVQQVVDAENDGFDSYWTPQVMGTDALTIIALAGQTTGRIQMGTAVVPTFTRHPLALAQQALTANAATGGRLNLGIGLSHQPVVEGRLGLSFDRPALHMREYLAVLGGLVHDGRVDFSGELFEVNTSLETSSAPSMPILVAALGPRMLRVAAELAEGTVTWMVGRKTLETHIVPRINAAAEGAGRPAPRVCVGVPIAVTDDANAAGQEAASRFNRYGALPSYRRMLDIEGVEGPAQVTIFGNETEVERQVRGLADAGATELVAAIFPVGEDQLASMQRTRSLLKSLVGKI